MKQNHSPGQRNGVRVVDPVNIIELYALVTCLDREMNSDSEEAEQSTCNCYCWYFNCEKRYVYYVDLNQH
jgi:hypothetical protein